MIDLTELVQAIVGAAVVLITTVLIPYIRSRTSEARMMEAQRWINIAVQEAEQLFRGSGLGKQKKEYVLDWLRHRGIVVDADRVDAMIESAVHEMRERSW